VSGELAKVREEVEGLREVVVGLRREILMLGGQVSAEQGVGGNKSEVKAEMRDGRGGGEGSGETAELVAGLRREVERYGQIVEELAEVNGKA